MSKIAILIDPHITERHRCRCDNFLETILNKMDYIASQNDYVVIGGDLFHTNTNSHLVFNKVYKLLRKHSGKFIAMPGNHDLFHNNINMLEKTTIGSLALTGALKLELQHFQIGEAFFQISPVIKNLKNIPIDSSNSKILLGHNYFELPGAPKETFEREEIRKLNYKLVFLGHDHRPYDEEYIGNSTLIRMGSLSRIDTQKYNKERKIYYYQVDSETLEYKKLEVPHKPAKEVFTMEAYSRIGRVKEDVTFIHLGEVLAKFKKKDNINNSLHNKLIKIATEKEIEYIKYLHEINNIRYF